MAQQGADAPNKIAIWEQLMDSRTPVITSNTSTMYAYAPTDLANDGPTVIEIPPGMLGFLDDAWQRFVGNMGVTGPDKGKGGKYLVLPPGYEGEVPDGYFLLRAFKTNKNFPLSAWVHQGWSEGGSRQLQVRSADLPTEGCSQSGTDTVHQHVRQILQHDISEHP